MNLCLIGSTRFMDKYLEVNRRLSLGGHIVYSVATRSSGSDYGKPKDAVDLTEDEKETLDLVHLQKILRSDAVVLITDATGYYGSSTKREIKWALMLGKPVVLPEHVNGLNMEKAFEDIQESIASVSHLDLKTKLDRSKFRL